MKSSKLSAQIILVLVICFLVPVAFAGTAFTYQGRLLENNAAADGWYDMQFKLYDDPNMLVGSPVGSPVVLEDLEVIDGYFIAELDFGGGAFDGDARWLEIAVRPFDQTDPNDFVEQSPLQEITPTPYAMYAESSGAFSIPLSITESSEEPLLRLENTGGGWGVYSLAHGTWSALYGYHYNGGNMASIGTPTAGIEATSSTGYAGIFNGKTKVNGNLTVENSGNVGIGTAGPVIDLAIGDTDTGLQQQGDGQLAVYTNNIERVRINSSGNVGIGTSSPSSPLDIKTSSTGYISVERGSNQHGGILWKETGATDTQWIFPYYRGWQSDNLIVREEVSNIDVMTFEFGTGDVGIGTSDPSAKLDVVGTFQLQDGNQADGKVLVSDASGNATWKKGSKYTLSGDLNTASINATTTWAKLADFVTFTKDNAATNIEVTMNTRAYAGTFSGGAWAVKFRIRIDDQVATNWLDNIGSVLESEGKEFISMFAVFQGLSAGQHTVSIWVQTAGAAGGVSDGVVLDPGGYAGRILVKEVW